MRAVVLRSLIVVGIGALILSGVLYLASTVDARAPAVAAVALTQTLPDEPGIGLPTTSLEVTFTEPMDTESAGDIVRIEPEVTGNVNWRGSVLIFTPSDPLALATSYTVTIEPGARDLAGNAMVDVPTPFTFETTGPPELVDSEPLDDATDVSLDASIAIRFSGLMDTASVEAALRLRPIFAYTLRWSGQELQIEPAEPFRPETDYRVEIGPEAIDVSGVPLGEPISLSFRTLGSGLEPSLLVPADGTDGVARHTTIAAVFSQPIDPDTVSVDDFVITPEISGSIDILDDLGRPPAEPDDGTILRFTPSGPLPPTTTFEVRLGGAMAGLNGGGLPEPVTWTFTTGAPQSTLTNQIVFLSDRAGVANLWGMNVDGSAPRQLSAELTPVLDYAVAPDGGTFVVGDGRRLVMQNADGSDRQVLTEDDVIEFDPAFSPDGQRLAFARASAADGAGLGIWEWAIPAGSTSALELPEAWSTSDEDLPHRAPRYAPDGAAIAFVDTAGWVAIVDLDDGPPVRARYDAQRPPIWLPDASAVVLTGRPSGSVRPARAFDAPVEPLAARSGGAAVSLSRGGDMADAAQLGSTAVVLSVGPDGRIVYRDGTGSLMLTAGLTDEGRPVAGADETGVDGVAFAPGENALVIVAPRDGRQPEVEGALVRIGLADGRRTVLTNDGWRPRWLP
ncbi:MAG: Ig-like domain-containing protein [Candidatus Limnocylindria bacterium]